MNLRREIVVAVLEYVSASNDVGLEHGGTDEKASEVKSGEIDGVVLFVEEKFGQTQPGRRRLLDPVTGEARAKVDVVVVGMIADHAIFVEIVVVVISGPGVFHFAAFKGRDSRGEQRPNLRREWSDV